ncbi:MAG: DNA polymerase III subunit beta [Clostridia bacterium]|nr:DNA polymerase III subunit beta [Clostridia bacterium]
MIRVDGKQFNKALKLLSKGVPRSSVLPQLEYAQYMAKNGTLTLTTTNLDTFIKVTVLCEGYGEGNFHLKDVAKLTKGAKQVKFGSDVLNADGMVMQIYGIDADELPVMPKMSGESIALTPEFFTALSKALPYVGTDELRPKFTTVWLNGSDIVGTDTHRMYVCNIGLDLPTCAIPGYAAAIFGLVFKEYSREAALLVNDRYASLTAENVAVITRLVEGELPDYKKLVEGYATPKAFAKVNGKAMQDAVTRLSAKSKEHILVHVNKDRIKLTADGATVTVPAETDGENLEVIFNPLYLRDSLATFKDREELILEFFGERGPVVIHGDKELSLTLPQWDNKK